MAGLMARGGGAPPMAPGGPGSAPAAPAGPMPGPGGNGQARKASPEEQRTYEDFVGQLINVAYEEGTANMIASQLQNAQDPVEAVANAAAIVVSRVASSAGENQVPVTRPMIVRATAELVGDIGKNMAESVGAQPLDDNQFQGAYLRAMDLLGQQASQMRQGGGAEMPPGGPEAPAGPGMAAAGPPPAPGGGLMPRMAPGG